MLPLYKTKNIIFNYDEIPPGHYHNVMINGPSIQRFWHKQKFREVASLVDEKDTVLDFGCGPGSFLFILSNEFKFENAFGIDIASGQIKFAMQTNKNQKVKFIPIEGSLLIPLPDQSVDFISVIEVIEHIHPFLVVKIFEELRRVLKDDGKIVVTTPNYRSFWPFIEWALNKLSPVKYHEQHINKYTPNSFIKFLETCGLEVMSTKSFFILSPFLAFLPFSIANFLMKIEKKLFPQAGSLLISQCRKVNL